MSGTSTTQPLALSNLSDQPSHPLHSTCGCGMVCHNCPSVDNPRAKTKMSEPKPTIIIVVVVIGGFLLIFSLVLIFVLLARCLASRLRNKQAESSSLSDVT